MSTSINMFHSDPNPVIVPAGAVVFSDGDVGDIMYGVISGEIAISASGTHIETIGPGGIIGEMALIDGGQRSADAVALIETRLSRIDGQRFERLVADHPTFALQVMRVMAERLRRSNNERVRHQR